MRRLPQLLVTGEGRELLARRGVASDPEEFSARLRPPLRSGLAARLGLRLDAPLVYVAQQAQPDYGASVMAKIRTAQHLRRSHHLEVVALWLDTDRTGSSRAHTTIAWPGSTGVRSTRLASQRFRDHEPRFVPVSPEGLATVLREVRPWMAGSPGSEEALRRHERLLEAVAARQPRTLAEAGVAIASFVLAEHHGFDAPWAFVSHLAEVGLLRPAIEAVLGAIDDVIAVVNREIEALAAADVDPVLRPLPDDYLPLHYSCPVDGSRRRLRHVRRPPDHFAVADCRCGSEYGFHLGSGSVSLGELAVTARWSVDVLLPVHLNGITSGAVVGQSSALYGMVLNAVVAKVLGEEPIPMLVPEDLPAVLGDDGAPSMLTVYLSGA